MNERPDPDKLLARVQAEESRARRGKLKIFFGYAAGVGKTYAMLQEARQERAEGKDVVVGYVEPHGRPETTALLEGLEVTPPLEVPYRGVTLRELDLDAVLKRKPRLALVDELAHTNAQGCRHAKRWQDVEELLEAGIDVYSTLNVQHVESLNDVIAQITGVVIRETIPDAVIERADDFELVDISPDELLERLREGKVYVPQQAEQALRHFFQQGNLTALRELSLRQVADRLRRDVDEARRERAATAPWATGERLLVGVGPSPMSPKLIRAAKRMAAAFGAEWLAVAVETGAGGPAAERARELTAGHLRLAERLGAQTHTAVATDVAGALLDFAREHNVTKIVVGKTALPWWRRAFLGTVVDALLERSGDIDIYVIRGESSGAAPRAPAGPDAPPPGWGQYAATAAVVALCSLLAWPMFSWQLAEANIVMVFLLGVAFVATRYGHGPAVAASVASVLVVDFLFVPPYLTFAVSDTQYLFTFAVMLVIGVTISTLAARLRARLHLSQGLERRTAALYRLTRQLTEIAGVEFLVQTAGRQLAEIFGGEAVIYLREPGRPLQMHYGEGTSVARHEVNAVVAAWVADHDQAAGAGTDTLPNATALFVPLVGSQRTAGAIGVRPADPGRLRDPELRRSLETCASLIALSLERDRSVLEAHRAQAQAEAEQLRGSLLSCVSHDLRTPLAAIAGTCASLLGADDMPEATRRELLQTVVEESRRLSRLVDNLLDMTRLESGVTLNRQWHVLEEIVGGALARLRRELGRRAVAVDVPADLPLLSLDGLLLEQVLVNLLENAARYTPETSRVEVSAREAGGRVELRVADDGPGLPPGGEGRLFEKFFRGTTSAPDGRRGVGLGLAICRAIVEAHGGRIEARNRPQGGAEFVVSLPVDAAAPRVSLDEAPAGGGS